MDGHIARTRNATDKRAITIALTERGRRLLVKDIRSRKTWLEAAIAATLNACERQLLVATSEAMLKLAFQEAFKSEERDEPARRQNRQARKNIIQETVMTSPDKNLSIFFLLVFAGALPFLLFSAASRIDLLPHLPIAALMAISPATAAAILTYKDGGFGGVKVLLCRASDYRRIPNMIWVVPALLLPPVLSTISFLFLCLTGQAIPTPQFPLTTTTGLILVFFVGALAEELGWSGYATDPLQQRFGALGGAAFLGLMWALFHLVALFQAGRSLLWIGWWSVGTIATRVLIVWLYNNTGKSVFAAALLHAMGNVCWQLFPVHGSYFDPRANGIVTALAALAVTVFWGPGERARKNKTAI